MLDGRAEHESTRSVNGELSTVASCPGQTADSRVAVLTKLRGFSQKLAEFEIKHTYHFSVLTLMG